MTAEAPTLQNYPLFRQGKVRDLYDLGEELLLVATDRLSTFDVVMPTEIPDKGRLLTGTSLWWFDQIADILPNHLVDQSLADLDLSDEERTYLDGRSMRGRMADRIDIECVVRGYLAGTGWKEYRASGTLAGASLPAGLQLGSELPHPVFTPAIKNDAGHDENISIARLRQEIDPALADELERLSLALYERASAIAARAGFILADTKFEFGHIDGTLSLIDEVLTPDSSRYWEASLLEPGKEPPSFDKQIIRDWVESTDWNKQAPGPEIPEAIVTKARERYQAVHDRLLATSPPDTSNGSAVPTPRFRGARMNATTTRYVIEAEVMPKQGVNDPQGDSILSGLRSLGFAETARVRCGKLIRLEVEADSEAAALARATTMCEQPLANPVIEEFEVRAIPASQVEVGTDQ